MSAESIDMAAESSTTVDQSAVPLPRGKTNAISPPRGFVAAEVDSAAAAEDQVDEAAATDDCDVTAEADVAAGTPCVESSHCASVLVVVGEAAATAEEKDGWALRFEPSEDEAEAEAEEWGFAAQDLFLLLTSFLPTLSVNCARAYTCASVSFSSRLNPAMPLRSEDKGGRPKCALGIERSTGVSTRAAWAWTWWPRAA